MPTWSDEDFRRVFTFLGNMSELLRDDPNCIAEYAEILLADCRDASAALSKISAAVQCR